MSTDTATLVRRLNLGVASHRALANRLDALDQALALDLPDEARAGIIAARDTAVAEVEVLVAEHAAAVARGPRVVLGRLA